jgi:DNA primase
MQLYWKTHTAYCFSSNCKTHGKSMDVIDFIMYKEGCSKHEAIEKAVSFLSGTMPNPAQQLTRTAILTKMFTYFKNAVHNSKPARDYIESRGLDFSRLEIGYNTGQFHHGSRREEALIQSCVAVGLLSPFGVNNRRPEEQAYKPFAKYSLVFALRSRSGQVTGMYFRSTVNEENQKHYYLKESSGLYPKYPDAGTEKLILTESIIDAASLLQLEAISKQYSLLAAYGTNRLSPEHVEAIKELKSLKEIIFAFDNDEAGNKAAEKYGRELKQLLPQVVFSKLELPCKDVNETAIAHQSDIFLHLLENRVFLFSNEKSVEKEKPFEKPQADSPQLDTRSPFKIAYKTAVANFYIQGGVSKGLDSMKVTLVIEHLESQSKTRNKLDLYEDKQVEKTCKEVADIVGEEKNRIFLLLIAASYKMPETLHALIQGSSGSGKTRLLKQISDCIPKEKVTRLTRVSDKVLYNYPEKYFINRLLCLEDIDGLSEEAEFAFRELQSNGELNSATSSKLENGQIVAGQKTVKGPIASLACTTRGEIYEDNMSRVFLLAVDESMEQTRRIIHYQNQRAAGLVDKQEEKRVTTFVQNFIRELRPYEVVNPYANKVHLPEEAHKIRRLNDLFQGFVKMITVLNQYQRRKDARGRLIVEIADVEAAVGIMFESIVLKVDELDGSLRQFYEKLKDYLKKAYNGQHEKTDFGLLEVRQALHVSKTQLFRYINDLMALEYIKQSGGHANRGFKYRIAHWDNYQAIREKIRQHLTGQLEGLKEHHGTPVEHQHKA